MARRCLELLVEHEDVFRQYCESSPVSVELHMSAALHYASAYWKVHVKCDLEWSLRDNAFLGSSPESIKLRRRWHRYWFAKKDPTEYSGSAIHLAIYYEVRPWIEAILRESSALAPRDKANAERDHLETAESVCHDDLESILKIKDSWHALNRETPFLYVLPSKGLREAETPLLFAIGIDRAAEVRLLLQYGADANAKASSGNSALHHTFQTTILSEEFVRILLSHGADVNAKSPSGQPVLHRAIRTGQFPSIEILIEHGATVVQCDSDGVNALQLAFQYRAPPEDISLLARHTARAGAINHANKYGNTALHYAVMYSPDANCRSEYIQLLEDLGADSSLRDRFGSTPYYFINIRDEMTRFFELDSEDQSVEFQNVIGMIGRGFISLGSDEDKWESSSEGESSSEE